ncbi:MAG: DUF58 domain-containing protein [Spirochaetaceae bacterium]|nr:MAG: DUF58 domain-containing protein [Spirochaetaceae bacterium]
MKLTRLWFALPSALLFAIVPVAAIQWASAFVALTLFVSAAYSRLSWKHLHVTRVPEALSCFRHQSEQIAIRIENRGLLPIAHLSLSEPTGNLTADGRTADVVSLPGRSTVHMRYSIRGSHRGLYSTGPLRIRAADPLGIFPWTMEPGGKTEVSVYPAIHPFRLAHSRGLPAGNLASPNPLYADPTRYRGLRDYVRGDDIRHVSWKATARTGSLKTVEHLPALYFPTLVILNLRSGDFGGRGRYASVERCIECAAAVLRNAADLGQSFGFVVSAALGDSSGEFAFPSGNGHEHMVAMLRAMAQADVAAGQMNVTSVLGALGPVSPGSRLFYVGPALPLEQLIRLGNATRPHSELELLFASERRRMPAQVLPLPFRRIPEFGAFDFA